MSKVKTQEVDEDLEIEEEKGCDSGGCTLSLLCRSKGLLSSPSSFL